VESNWVGTGEVKPVPVAYGMNILLLISNRAVIISIFIFPLLILILLGTSFAARLVNYYDFSSQI
jgi:hypothetical protein